MARAYGSTSSSLYSINEERPACGFLNRKTLTDPTGKKSKDRWQTLWCQVVDSTIVFYKVDRVVDKDPPPKDIFPLPNCAKHKVGFAKLDEALVEVDLMHQKDIDIDKRRLYLFRLLISNNLEYILQAPSENQMHQWVHHLRKASWKSDDEESDLLRGDGRIKMSRCSINKKSKHNTNSVRMSCTSMPVTEEEEEDHSSLSLIQLDPRLLLLKKRLQSKRELLKHLQKMLTSFAGDSECLYREADPNSTVGRHHSTRSHSVSMTNSVSTSFAPSSQSSISGYSMSMSHSENNGFIHSLDHGVEGGEFEQLKRRSTGSDTVCVDGVSCTTLTEDRYLLPGADWSLMKKGETVEVLGRLPNGWYRCRAMRSITMDLKPLPSSLSADSMSDAVIAEDSETTTDRENETDPDMHNGADTSQDTQGEMEEEEEAVASSFHEMSTISSNGDISTVVSPTLSPSQEEANTEIENESGNESEAKNEHETEELLNISQAGQIMEHSGKDKNGSAHEEADPRPADEPERDEGDDTFTPVVRRRTDSYALAMGNSLNRVRSLGRTDSYYRATKSGLVDRQGTRHLSLLETRMDEVNNPPSQSSKMEIQRLRINNLLEHERANSKYIFPLIGAVPPSGLQHFATQLGTLRPASSTSDYASSTPVGDDSPPQSSAHNSEHSPHFEVPNTSPVVSQHSSIPATSVDISATECTLPLSASVPSGHGNSLLAVPQHASAQRSSSLPPPTETIAQPPPQNNTSSRQVSRRSSLTAPSTLDQNATPSAGESSWKNKGRRRSDGSLQESGLDDSRKLSVMKKVFGKKQLVPPALSATMVQTTPPVIDGSESTVKLALPAHLRDGEASPLRSRVASISGKPIWARGREVRIGEESSSDSESDGAVSPLRPTSRAEDRSSPEDGAISSVESSPLLVRKMIAVNEGSIRLTGDSVSRPHAGPLDLLRSRAITRIQSDSTILDSRKENTTEAPFNRRSSLYDSDYCKLADYLQPPEKGLKRCIELDKSHGRYGFHLETYELHMEGGRVPQTFVQYVVPGSPAFVAGLFPGDCILEVNGQDVHHCHANEVVSAIQKTKGERVELMVAFVDGVARLKLMKKADELRTQMKERQSRLEDLQATQQVDTLRHSSPLLSTTSALDLPLWSTHCPTELSSTSSSAAYVYPYSARLNSLLSVHHGNITELSCDLLVLPFDVPSNHIANELNRVLQAGGAELMEEMSLLDDCVLGENLLTSGHLLPAQGICHCMFGTSEDHLLSCCRSALETAYEQEYTSIAFWVDGFVKACISPHIIIAAVREWMEEGENSCRGVLQRVVFSWSSSSGLSNLIERYFPLTPSPSVSAATPHTTVTIPSTDDINLDTLSSFCGSDYERETGEEPLLNTANELSSTRSMSEPVAFTAADTQTADEALSEAMSMLSNRVESMLAEGLPSIINSTSSHVQSNNGKTHIPDHQNPTSTGDLDLGKLDSLLAELNDQVTSFTNDEEDWNV